MSEKKFPAVKCPPPVKTVYKWFWDKALEMEHRLKEIPESPQEEAMQGPYGVNLLYPAICTIKEISKELQNCDFEWLSQSGHYQEEIGLLKKRMDDLREDIRRSKLRGDWVRIER